MSPIVFAVGPRATRIVRGMLHGMMGVSTLWFAVACNDFANSSGADVRAASGSTESSEITIVMRDNVFEPEEPVANRGKVTIHYDNQGVGVHNLILQSRDAGAENRASKAAVQPGEKGTIEAVFPMATLVKFICSYHAEMRGTLAIQ